MIVGSDFLSLDSVTYRVARSFTLLVYHSSLGHAVLKLCLSRFGRCRGRAVLILNRTKISWHPEELTAHINSSHSENMGLLVGRRGNIQKLISWAVTKGTLKVYMAVLVLSTHFPIPPMPHENAVLQLPGLHPSKSSTEKNSALRENALIHLSSLSTLHSSPATVLE